LSGRYDVPIRIPLPEGGLVASSGVQVVDFRLGDVVTLRRAHPCGGREWQVDRLGADIGIRCSGCGRHVLLDRRTLERRLVGFVSRGNEEMSRAVAPVARDEDQAPPEGGR
jgi:hypothetical protein